MRHELKCWKDPFEVALYDRKHHEIRKNDRGFEVGDEILLKEWIPAPRPRRDDEPQGAYTGRDLLVVVTYISRGPEWGIPEGLVVMSIERPKRPWWQGFGSRNP